MQRILLLGSTGSIGESTLRVLSRHRDLFRVSGMSANGRWERLVEQAREWMPVFVHVTDEHRAKVQAALAGSGIEVLAGRQALVDCPAREEVDTLLSAIVGTAGLEPLVTAIRARRGVCFANKEPLVTAGEAILAEARKAGVQLMPVDSEHSAILQCIQGESRDDLSRIILTASGGPFRDATREEFLAAGRDQALQHPTWVMGAKITIDSATLMNKALEIIEAAHLYDLPEDRIDVLIHPQSIIHSMVEFRDGSVKAQLGIPDMRIPILYALAWPRHLELDVPAPDWKSIGRLEFREPDCSIFRSLGFAREALRKGEGWACVMNAANEVAVELFLEDRIPFKSIYSIVEDRLEAYSGGDHTLEDLIERDRITRAECRAAYEEGKIPA